MIYPDCDRSPEAAIALRQRLNETVEQLDELRHKHTELEVNFESQSKELTIAKSDCESYYSPRVILNNAGLSDTCEQGSTRHSCLA